MQIYDLTVMHLENPLGIEGNPYFGWKIESEQQDTIQIAYQIKVSDDKGRYVWRSERVKSDKSSFVPYEGETLLPKMRYVWTVTVWDNHDEKNLGRAYFETALNQENWKAKWMRVNRSVWERGKGFGKQPPATLFRRAFFVDRQIVSARIYATCIGVYRLTVNGVRPDDREFAPEHTSYRKYICYQTYDITKLLQQGENVVGMEVGDGWYCCPQTRPPVKDMNPDHAILFQLEICYANGSCETICSDDEVVTEEGEVRFSDIFDGECQDARLKKYGWDRPGYCTTGWKPAIEMELDKKILHAQIGQPVRPIISLSAKRIYRSKKDEMIVDFGQVVAGRTRVFVDLPKGEAVTLEHFEEVDKNGCYYNNIQGAMGYTEQKDVFISDGTPRVFEAKFSFHGFRYLRVTGLQDAKLENFSAVVLSSEKSDAGTFMCSDERLNRLYENTRWSQRANMLSIPTDCPQREKAGWTGDIALYAKTALLNEDVTAFLTRWLASLACDQRKNGSVPFTVPDTSIYHYNGIKMGESTGCGGPVCSAGWGDAAVRVPWALYEVTGNTEILKTQYCSMKHWCDYVISRAKIHAPGSVLPDEVEEHLWNTGFQFGEWLIPSLAGEPQDKIFETMAKSAAYTAPIFGWMSVDYMTRISDILGEKEDAAYYSCQAKLMKQAIVRGLIDEKGAMKTERQGAYVLMLALELVPDCYKNKFAERLEELIHQNGDHLDTGFLTTPYLLDALCKAGKWKLAYTLLYQDTSPSWLAQVKAGATTIWESWEMYQPDGMPKNESFNHYAFGCVDDWIFRNLAGMDQQGCGYKHLILQPKPDVSLKWAKRTFMTEQGLAKVEWSRENGQFYMSVTIPCNADALVILPDGEQIEVGSGEYTFCCEERKEI